MKRKQPFSSSGTGRQQKRARLQDARTIAAQTSGKAFGNGELDVEKFVQTRENEIKALEKSIKRSRSALSTRAFQSVPRELRRRTASHNVKRVPKRLRARAQAEMREDNTPAINTRTRKLKATGKQRLRLEIAGRKKRASDKTRIQKAAKKQARQESATPTQIPPLSAGRLQRPATPKAKFRKRQRFKAWLPTHLFHAKRAHMPPSKEPLWRMAIPLSPTQRCYRSTHRAANTRGAVAWDKSYISTIGLVGSQSSIIGVLRALSVGANRGESWWTTKATRWLSGTRVLESWVYERDTSPKRPIAPVSIMWQVAKGEVSTGGRKAFRRQAFIRVHPSAFLQLWDELLKLSEIQKPAVLIQDLRFEIGSIEVIGPAAMEALVGTLWPVCGAADQPAEGSPEAVWRKLRGLSSPAQLPTGAALGFGIVDPRLHHPARTIATAEPNGQDQNDLLTVLTSWPVDQSQQPQQLYDRRARVLAGRQLPSQRSINRRKSQAPPGAYPEHLSSDPHIPIIAYSHRPTGAGQAAWTLMMPWKCVTPVWYALLFYSLSGGGTMRFGGLDQTRQLAFETGTPWFPADYPGTRAGAAWESADQQKRKAKWESRPRDRRTAFDAVDLAPGRTGEIGVAWACDWDYLSGSTEKETHERRSPSWTQIQPSEAIKVLRGANEQSNEIAPLHLAAVEVTMLQQGLAESCARVYRLPTTDLKMHNLWLERSAVPTKKGQAQQWRNSRERPHEYRSAQERRQYLAAMLLGKPDALHDERASLPIPHEVDLIGFVTTGNFNLAEGVGTGMASIALDKVTRLPGGGVLSNEQFQKARHLCIVRNSGQSTGRLARWELV